MSKTNTNKIQPEDINDLVKNIRDIIRKKIQENPELYYNKDIKHIEDDEWIIRFLEEKNYDVHDALKSFDNALKWRKSYGVNDMKDTDFPAEFFRTSELHTFHDDKNGIHTLYIRVSHHRILSQWKEIEKRFIIYNLECLYEKYRKDKHKIGIIVDARNGSILKTELDLNYFGFRAIIDYYPRLLKYIVIYELPWILNTIFHLIKSWFPVYYKNLFILVNKDNHLLDELIGLDYIPKYMNGRADMYFPESAQRCLECKDFVKKHKMPETAYKQFDENYRWALDEYEKFKEKIANQNIIANN